MKKILILLLIATMSSSCYTYVPELGRIVHKRANLRRYHRMGINGFHIPQRRYNRIVIPSKK